MILTELAASMDPVAGADCAGVVLRFRFNWWRRNVLLFGASASAIWVVC